MRTSFAADKDYEGCIQLTCSLPGGKRIVPEALRDEHDKDMVMGEEDVVVVVVL